MAQSTPEKTEAAVARREQRRGDIARACFERLADEGAHVGAMTPGELAEFVAERIGR